MTALTDFCRDRSGGNVAVEVAILAGIAVAAFAFGFEQIRLALQIACASLDGVLDDSNNPSVDGF